MATPKKPKRKIGRPSKYDPKYCEALIDHMKKGLSYETFSAVIDVDDDTLYEWEKHHSEFSEAKAKAFKLCQLWWETTSGQGARGQIKNFSAPMTIFNLKCRFPKNFREPLRVEHTGVDGKPIQHEDAGHAKLVKALAAAMAGKKSDEFD